MFSGSSSVLPVSVDEKHYVETPQGVVQARITEGLSEIVEEGLLTRILYGRLRGSWFHHVSDSHAEYITGWYEMYIQNAIQALLRPGACFYDLGAHHGFHTILAAVCGGEKGRVIAFEPQGSNMFWLARNVEANLLHDRVICENVAVCDVIGEEPFHIANGKSDLGKLSTEESHPEWNGVKHTPTTKRTTTLDSYVSLPGVRPPNVIKVDVEGSEARALIGAREVLAEFSPKLILSVHGTRMTLACAEILSEYGYQVQPIHGDEVLLCWKPSE